MVGAVADHAEHLVLVERVALVQEAALLDDELVQTQFDLGPFHNLLLDRVVRDEAEDAHLEPPKTSPSARKWSAETENSVKDGPDLFGLADAMGAVHGLQVHLRVPVRVEEDDDVGRGQVDAEAAGARRQHEDELGAALGVELGNLPVAVLVRRRSVQPAVLQSVGRDGNGNWN